MMIEHGESHGNDIGVMKLVMIMMMVFMMMMMITALVMLVSGGGDDDDSGDMAMVDGNGFVDVYGVDDADDKGSGYDDDDQFN